MTSALAVQMEDMQHERIGRLKHRLLHYIDDLYADNMSDQCVRNTALNMAAQKFGPIVLLAIRKVFVSQAKRCQALNGTGRCVAKRSADFVWNHLHNLSMIGLIC